MLLNEDHRLYAPATARNREVILEQLISRISKPGLMLEIASGTGEHACFFSSAMPHLTWQPTDLDPEHLASIASHIEADGLDNVQPPVFLNVLEENWPLTSCDYIFNANMIHISPWTCTLALMAGAGRLLSPGGQLYMYGPYLRSDVETAPSNLSFDQSLKNRNPDWGIRHLDEVVSVAEQRKLTLNEVIEMPANNLLVVYQKQGI